MGLTGKSLGAELGAIYRLGKQDLPAVSADYRSAWTHTPVSVSTTTSRGGGLGDDPGPMMDTLLDRLNKATDDTSEIVDDVAARLVWTATDYEITDTEAQQEFDKERKKVDG